MESAGLEDRSIIPIREVTGVYPWKGEGQTTEYTGIHGK
jgi:hypothetical protein